MYVANPICLHLPHFSGNDEDAVRIGGKNNGTVVVWEDGSQVGLYLQTPFCVHDQFYL